MATATNERIEAAVAQREQAQAAGTLTQGHIRHELGEKVRAVEPEGQWHEVAEKVLAKDAGLRGALIELVHTWPNERPA